MDARDGLDHSELSVSHVTRWCLQWGTWCRGGESIESGVVRASMHTHDAHLVPLLWVCHRTHPDATNQTWLVSPLLLLQLLLLL